ncbi:MAG: ABC transporter permease [Bacteroidota bacterium]|nr:ABC transporter permease [Bacteroidota bacterium]
MDTILNNLKLAWRSFKRDKLYSWVKISSLAIGGAACILIALFVRNELNYDKHYQNTDRIYRLVKADENKGKIRKSVYMPAALARALMDDYPEIEKAGRISNIETFGAGSNQIRREGKLDNSFEEGVVFGDQQTLEILEAQFINGNPQNALSEANSMVITKSRADKFFPNENPIGKTILINNDIKKPYTITGVIEDFPENSHLEYHFFIALQNLFTNFFGEEEQTSWSGNRYITYCSVKEGTDIASLEKKLENIVSRYDKTIKSKKSYEFQPVTDIYLNREQVQDLQSHGDIQFVWILSAIAACILILACINFINLFLAISGNRAKEVGFRKTIGAKRNSIVFQFISESVLYSFISVLAGVVLAWIFLPWFNNLSSKSLTMPWTEWWFFPLIISISVIIGTIAGFYPSLFLSRIEPTKALKGKVNQPKKMAGIFSSLVVFQFAASITLVVCSTMVYRQMDFIMNKKIGFEKEQVLVLKSTNTLGSNITPFKNELLTIPNVQSVSTSSFLPIENTKRNSDSFWDEQKGRDANVVSQIWAVDCDYIKTMGMNIIEGREFSTQLTLDKRTAIVNQTMAKELNLKNPIGAQIVNSEGQRWEIVGVVEDFNFESLKTSISPLFMVLGNSNEVMAIKVKTSDIQTTIRSIEQKWAEFSPSQSIRYSFLDQEFALMDNDTERMGSILLNFTFLAIFIACLGLFALAQFTIKKRIKEIGIRKVNGARVSEVMAMLNRDFVIWVAIAFVIATPIAYYAMNKWLENFAYKTSLSWWIFALAGLMALGIAMLTVSWQSWKAATRNPVEALRYE